MAADLSRPVDISIPLNFAGEQPNHFGAPPACAEPLRAGEFIGDTRQGGSCNVAVCHLIPHCNGTHTECIGHITRERISVNAVLREVLIPATLITVSPQPAETSPDGYRPDLQPGDHIITRQLLQEHSALQAQNPFLRGLIVRTLPNAASKKSRDYAAHPAPFFSLDAMEFLAGLPLHHLLVDLPSVDRAHDQGLLSAHHVFWEVPPGSHRPTPRSRRDRTITEMIYVPDDVPDGMYLLSIQIPDFCTDAAPARVLLFPVRQP